MFKKILVPTDGSALSDKAIDMAVRFARDNGAKIVGISVAEPYPLLPVYEGTPADSVGMYTARMLDLAREHARKIADAATAMQVPCETIVAQSLNPSEEIVKAARESRCDVIFMASHGRKGLSKLFLGSETQKVLAQTNIPVLVCR